MTPLYVECLLNLLFAVHGSNGRRTAFGVESSGTGMDAQKKIELLHSLHEKNQANQDQALLAISTATLGFTITVFTNVYKGHWIAAIVITWILLAAAIVALLMSYGTAATVSDDMILLQHESAPSNKVPLTKKINDGYRLTKFLNRSALQAYVGALLTFVTFTAVNVTLRPKESFMIQTKVPAEPLCERGILPARTMLPTDNSGAAPTGSTPRAPSQSTPQSSPQQGSQE